MASVAAARSFGEEEYIDLDLSSCGEYEFRVCRSRAAEETSVCRGRLLHRVAPRPGTSKLPDAEASVGCGRRSAATVAPLQQSHVRSAQPARARAEGRRKAVRAKLQASRAFFRSLFARTPCSDERCHGGIGVPSSGRKAPFGQIKSGGEAGPTTLRRSIEQEKLMDEVEEHAASVRQRKSFSGVIRWRPTAPAPTPTPPPPPPLVSSSTRRKSCGSVPASCRSEPEPEGLIQGAIAYCKRTQQQQQRVLARKSVSDAALCSSWASS
jgi:hypothetical protein